MGAELQTEAEGANTWQLIKLFPVSPSQAFVELKKSPRWILPFLLLVLGPALKAHWYFSAVDIDWYRHEVLATVTGANAQGRVQALMMTSRDAFDWSRSLSAMVGAALSLVTSALYLLLIGKVFRMGYSFGRWFAFSCWSATPVIIGLILVFLAMLLTDTSHADIASLQPASLNELFFHSEPTDPGYHLLNALTVFTFAQAWLSVIGMRVWSGRSVLFSTVVALTPQILFFGVWALFAFELI